MEARKVEIGSRLSVIERDGDVTGLATSTESEQWNKVQLLERALQNSDPSDPATEDMRAKLRLIRGVLYWSMNGNYKARLWHAQKEQRELEVAVKEARRRWTLIERARAESPKQTEEFAARVANLTPRIATMEARLMDAGEKQNQYLAEIAIHELEAQKERLAAYGLQAQFALAAIYDHAAAGSSQSSNAPSPPVPNSGIPADQPAAPQSTPSVTPPPVGEPIASAAGGKAGGVR
jgi:hypothetical protein